VEVFEHLLEFGLATVTVPGLDGPLVVQTPADRIWNRGDELRLGADSRRVLLFDPETGDRVR
jgi:multiple sugar transport system ATP-binding protein